MLGEKYSSNEFFSTIFKYHRYIISYMKRTSEYIAELVHSIDGIAGLCFSKSNNDKNFEEKVCQYKPLYVLADVALVNSQLFLEGVAKAVEYIAARPLHHVENLFLGKKYKSNWMY